MANVTLTALQAALSDVDYPVAKEDLVAHVEEQGGDDAVLRALRSLPPVDYGNAEEVIRSVGPDVVSGPPGAAEV